MQHTAQEFRTESAVGFGPARDGRELLGVGVGDVREVTAKNDSVGVRGQP